MNHNLYHYRAKVGPEDRRVAALRGDVRQGAPPRDGVGEGGGAPRVAPHEFGDDVRVADLGRRHRRRAQRGLVVVVVVLVVAAVS